MKNRMKKLTALMIVCVMILSMTACGLARCEKCGEGGGKAYKSYDGKHHFCDECAADCLFCDEESTHCYNSLLGVMFVCKDCYNEIMELNG